MHPFIFLAMEKTIKERIAEYLASSDEGMKQLGKTLQAEETMKVYVGLELIQKLQAANPLVIVGGSTSLYLQGIKLKRLYKYGGDIDIILPYYFPFEDLRLPGTSQELKKSNDSDFQYVMEIDGRAIDLRIDPMQRYRTVEFEGVRYKVSLVEDILAAKISYIPNKPKHKDDLYEMLGIESDVQILKIEDTDLFFRGS